MSFSLIHIGTRNTPIHCVLGVLDTPNGQFIAKEMLTWITLLYDVSIITHDGSEYEYPAISYSHDYAIEHDLPVLYLHTKGAANPNTSYKQSAVRNMWRYEFLGKYNWYKTHLTNDTVLCPYTGPSKTTWFNGFITTPSAFNTLGQIPKSTNRYIYERLFNHTDINVHGRVINDADDNGDGITKVIQMVNNVYN